MDENQKLLIKLIDLGLNPDKDFILPLENQWHDLYILAQGQGLTSILYPVVKSLGLENQTNSSLYDKWQDQVVLLAVLQLRRIEQMRFIIKSLDEAGVEFIVLKGLAVARLYENPEYRLMSDLDILVKEKDLLFAQQTIEQMGYDLVVDEEDHPFHLGYGKKGDLYIELHYSLLRPDILGKRPMHHWYDHIWSNKKMINYDQMEFYIMCEEDEIIHQILHYARHMISQAAHMKQVYDIALIIKKYAKQFDWDYIISEMEVLGLLKFGSLIIAVCSEFFSTEIPEAIEVPSKISPYQFLDRFLNDYSVVMKTGTEYKRTWSNLCRNAPYLCKSLITLPIVYVVDVMVQLIKNKKSIWESISISSNNIRYFANNIRILRGLGLIG